MSRSLGMTRAAAIIAAGLLALWIATGVTLNFTLARQAPALLRSWWPWGVTAKVTEGQALLATASGLPPARIDGVRAMLRNAVLREPVNTQALSTLAALDEFRGDKAQARTLFGLSEAVSRRNKLTEFWLIEDTVARGDVAKVISHYDRVMRVSVDSRGVLLPVMIRAVSDPAILRTFLPVLAQRPLWWKDYARELAADGDQAGVMVLSMRALRLDIRDPEERALAENILRRMVTLQHGREATVAANRFEGRPGFTRTLMGGRFETADGILPFAWWFRDEENLRAYPDAVPDGTIGLRIETGTGASGGVAQQLIGLAPGRHLMQGIAGDVPADPTTRPAIELSCTDGTPITRFTLPATPEQGRPFRFAFDVPTRGCEVQWVSLVTAPAVDTRIWLDDLAIPS